MKNDESYYSHIIEIESINDIEFSDESFFQKKVSASYELHNKHFGIE